MARLPNARPDAVGRVGQRGRAGLRKWLGYVIEVTIDLLERLGAGAEGLVVDEREDDREIT